MTYIVPNVGKAASKPKPNIHKLTTSAKTYVDLTGKGTTHALIKTQPEGESVAMCGAKLGSHDTLIISKFLTGRERPCPQCLKLIGITDPTPASGTPTIQRYLKSSETQAQPVDDLDALFVTPAQKGAKTSKARREAKEAEQAQAYSDLADFITGTPRLKRPLTHTTKRHLKSAHHVSQNELDSTQVVTSPTRPARQQGFYTFDCPKCERNEEGMYNTIEGSDGAWVFRCKYCGIDIHPNYFELETHEKVAGRHVIAESVRQKGNSAFQDEIAEALDNKGLRWVMQTALTLNGVEPCPTMIIGTILNNLEEGKLPYDAYANILYALATVARKQGHGAYAFDIAECYHKMTGRRVNGF